MWSTEPSISTASSASPEAKRRGKARARKAARPGHVLPRLLKALIELVHTEWREGAGEARGRAGGEDELGRVGEPPRLAARILEGEGQPMLGLDHLGRRIEPELLGIAVEVGDGDEQVERLVIGQQRRALRPLLHRVERVEQEVGELGPAEGRREPGRAHEIGELGLDLGAVGRLDGLVDRAGALGQRPGDGNGGELGDARHRVAAGREQFVDVGRIEPQIGQRIERVAGGDGMAEEDRVDPARAGAGEDVDDDPDVGVGLRGDGVEQRGIDVAGVRRSESRDALEWTLWLARARRQISLVMPCM